MRFFFAALWALLLLGCADKSLQPPTAEHVDLKRYTGMWYEIARYENRFEEGCAGATAEYKRRGGQLEIVNRCLDEAGAEISRVEGTAYAVNSSNAKLRVSFFWPFYGDYWILMLADDYRYSVVGDPDRHYLWILSRTPTLDPADKKAILAALPDLGYSSEHLFWTSYGKP